MRQKHWMIAVGIWCLILAVITFQTVWVYQLTHWGVCIAAIYAATLKKGNWRIAFIVIAVAFNPLFPILFDPIAWRVVAALSGVAFIMFGKSR